MLTYLESKMPTPREERVQFVSQMLTAFRSWQAHKHLADHDCAHERLFKDLNRIMAIAQIRSDEEHVLC